MCLGHQSYHSYMYETVYKKKTWYTIEEKFTFRKHADSNILKILQPKKEKFQIKNSEIFYMSPQNINCGYSLEPPRRGGSNEYPLSMFLAK